jgi:hypothetical protein
MTPIAWEKNAKLILETYMETKLASSNFSPACEGRVEQGRAFGARWDHAAGPLTFQVLLFRFGGFSSVEA